MLKVRFTLLDSYGRPRGWELTTTATTIADALTNVTSFVALFDDVSDAGLKEIAISTRDSGDAYAAVAGSNKDVGATLNATVADGYDFPLAIPMIKSSMIVAGGAVNLSDAAMTAFLAQFLSGGAWRLNNRTPTAVTAFNYGTLDE